MTSPEPHETRADPETPPPVEVEETRADPTQEDPETPETIRATARLVRRSSARIMAEQVDMGLRRRATGGVKRLGRYELRDLLGRGGSGSVYRAWDPQHEREVAVKILLHSHDPQARRRFEREIKATARLRHPTIVPLLDSGEDDDTQFLVMGLIEGRDLVACAQDGLTPVDACVLMREICLAIQFAHEQGILHRDIKPQNVLIDGTGKPLIVDFGLARLEGRDSHLTKTGTALGTPAYMPPEQVTAGRGDELDARSDVYSLGATLYHLIGRRPPFTGAKANVLLQIVEQDPPPLTSLHPACPEDVARFVHAALDKNPEARPPNARSMIRQLRELRELHYPEFVAADPSRRTSNSKETRQSKNGANATANLHEPLDATDTRLE